MMARETFRGLSHSSGPSRSVDSGGSLTTKEIRKELARWLLGSGDVADLVGTTEFLPHPDTDAPAHRYDTMHNCRRLAWREAYHGPILWEVNGEPALWIPTQLDMENKPLAEKLDLVERLHRDCGLPPHRNLGTVEELGGLFQAYFNLTGDDRLHMASSLFMTDDTSSTGEIIGFRIGNYHPRGIRHPLADGCHGTCCFFWKSNGDW